MTFVKSELFPITADVNKNDHLMLGGCDVGDLVSEYGTALLVFDEDTLRSICQEFVREFTSRYANTRVLYASKAYINPALARLIHEEGLGLDVVSGGELAVAYAAEVDSRLLYFHGNNKTPSELKMALDGSVGRVVIDSFHELEMLDRIAGDRGIVQGVMVRVSPGIDPPTHAKTTTGILDSKFGFSIETGHAASAIQRAIAAPNLDLVGIHFHLGSPIFELEPYDTAIKAVLDFLVPFKEEGLNLREFSPGGGFAIGYVRDEPPPPISLYARVITDALKCCVSDLGFGTPTLVVEPGRAIVGRAGVALYTVGGIKDIPTIRKYVSLDGGMGDNIRPALYDSRYEAVVANRMAAASEETVTLVGKYCESGDYLIKDIELPVLNPGDIIALPSSGAYAPSMASNYNLNPKPPVVMVKDGNARLIRRRETFEDMMLSDIL